MKLTSIIPFLLLTVCMTLPILGQEKEDQEPILKPIEAKSYIYFKVGSADYEDGAEQFWLADLTSKFALVGDNLSLESFSEPESVYRIGDHTRLTKWLGASVEFAHYNKVVMTVTDGVQTAGFERSSFGFNAALTPQFTWNKLTVYGLAGLSWARTNVELKEGAADLIKSDAKRQHDDQFSGIFGAGARYLVGTSLQVGLSYDQFEVDELELSSFSFDIGVVY